MKVERFRLQRITGKRPANRLFCVDGPSLIAQCICIVGQVVEIFRSIRDGFLEPLIGFAKPSRPGKEDGQ
jgi:hypothetical protein